MSKPPRTRAFKKVTSTGTPSGQVLMKFSYQHLPLIQKILGLENAESEAMAGGPASDLRNASQSTKPLPQRINKELNSQLIERFGTSNICWIALHSWVGKEWDGPDAFAEDTEFSCSYVHPARKFEITCESGDGFRAGVNSEGIWLDGTYRFDQMDEYFDVLDQMVKLPVSDWIAFWKKTHENQEAEAAAQKSETSAPSPAQERAERHRKEMAETVSAIEKEAEKGGAEAQYSAGVAFARGIGMEVPDFEKAAYWLAQAAAAGHFQAAKLLALVKKQIEEQNNLRTV